MVPQWGRVEFAPLVFSQAIWQGENMTNPQTYLIIADDGVQYGPITESDLRAWIQDRRVNGQNQAWQEGSAEWKPLCEHATFRGSFAAAAPPAPMARPPVAPPSTRHAATQRTTTDTPVIGTSTIVCSYLLAVLMPFFGFFAGIYLLAKKQPGHGVACIAISLLTFCIVITMMNS